MGKDGYKFVYTFPYGLLCHEDLEIVIITHIFCEYSLYRILFKGRLSETSYLWRSWYRASLMDSFKYNQQDATLYNILYYCQCCTCFRRFLRPSSGAQNCTQSVRYMSSLLAKCSSKQAWHIPDAVCTVLSSWWWVEKPPETCRAAILKLWSAEHKWSSDSALVVLLDWTLVQKRQKK